MLLRNIALAATATAVLALSGCGDDAPVSEATGDTAAGVIDGSDSASPSASEEPTEDVALPSEEDLEEYFQALSTFDVVAAEKAIALTAEKSLARAYLEYRIASLNAYLDAGTLNNYQEPQPAAQIEDGYESCDDPSDDSTCARWTNIEGADGLIVSFDVNDSPLNDVLRVGNGKAQTVGGIADIEILFAYQSPVSGNLFVIGKATTRGESVDLSSLYSSTYRDPSGRQFKSADSANPGELAANSTANFTTVFPAPAKIGGAVTLGFYDSDYNEFEAQFATK